MEAQFGRYQIVRELGRGATGIVYLARDTQQDRRVAHTVLLLPHPLQGLERANATERFLREARAAAAVRHPHIPQIYEVGSHAGRSYIAMEFCEGSTLRDVLKIQGTVAPAEALRIAREVLEALQAAHAASIFHRDVNPENVLLCPGNRGIKLMDFGIARTAHEATLTQTGTLLGTPAYMSPEQILARDVDGRSDLFSTAIVLHEMLTGRRPFEGSNITEITHAIAYTAPQIAPHLPPALRNALSMALAKEPAHRFLTAADMAAALADPELTQSVPLRPPVPPPAPAPAVSPLLAAGPYRAGTPSRAAPSDPPGEARPPAFRSYPAAPHAATTPWPAVVGVCLALFVLLSGAVGYALWNAATSVERPTYHTPSGAPPVAKGAPSVVPGPRSTASRVGAPPVAPARAVVRCPHCSGTGIERGCVHCKATGRCQHCEGKGYKNCFFCSGKRQKDCFFCKGLGHNQQGERCTWCGGAGGTSCEHCAGDGRDPCLFCRGSKKCSFCKGKPAGRCEPCGGDGMI